MEAGESSGEAVNKRCADRAKIFPSAATTVINSIAKIANALVAISATVEILYSTSVALLATRANPLNSLLKTYQERKLLIF
jgi:hypothetical protein